MCRWGCPYTNTTYMCKWCGTRYCKECKRGEFTGEMREPTICRKCNQTKCQGQRVEFVPGHVWPLDESKSGSKSAKGSRSKSPAKSAKGKKSAGKKKGSGKKKKKKK